MMPENKLDLLEQLLDIEERLRGHKVQFPAMYDHVMKGLKALEDDLAGRKAAPPSFKAPIFPAGTVEQTDTTHDTPQMDRRV